MLFLLLVIILLSTSFVQTKLAKFATKTINQDFGTDLIIKKVDLSFLGSIELKGIEIRDHHNDTLIFINKLSTSLLNAKRIINGEVKLNSVSIEESYLYMKTYVNEKNNNLSVFIDRFNTKQIDSTQNIFTLQTSNIYISNLNYKLVNQNDIKVIKYKAIGIGGNLQKFSIIGPNVTTKIRGLHFREANGLNITNLTTDFSYSLDSMSFKEIMIETRSSKIDGDILFTYNKEDLKDFNNKVKIQADFKKSVFSIRDFKKLYRELEGDDILSFSGKAIGTLNNLDILNLKLNSKRGLDIYGKLSFENLLNTNKGFEFNGNIDKLSFKYSDIKLLLPNVLGKKLPSELSRLGRVTSSGLIRVSPKEIEASTSINSEIGNIDSNIRISNIGKLDNAMYSGSINLKKFDIGIFLSDSLFNKISLKGQVKGTGFKLNNINTSFIGEVSELDFKNYKYTNIKANGQFQNNKFDGDLLIDDDNFKMTFNGLADLSKEIREFDFDANITHLNLKKTNLFTRDSIALLKGRISLDIQGNTLENIIGNGVFNDVFYTNTAKEFTFKEFSISSIVKENIKRIELISKDIANGYMLGKFTFSELLPVTQNILGSVFTNYKSYKVNDDQFLDFNFTIYNQIINVFFPEIFIDDKTKIKGKVVSNENQLKLNISSPRIEVFGNEIKDVKLSADHRNQLFNTSLTASELNTKFYNISKLNILNRTDNDTLYFKSVFEGGKFNNEEFNLDFNYTINSKGKSVVAFQESSFNFKENIWKIKPDKTNSDQITFDLNTNEFDFSQFKVISNKQEIEFSGYLKGDDEKKLLANFKKVKLQSFLPEIDSLALKGLLSGKLNFLQKEGIYNPSGSVLIKDFEINDFKQGDLILNIIGDNSYEKYNLDLSLNSKNVKNIDAKGSLDFTTKKPLIDLKVNLEEFKLDAFSPLGKNVLSSIRGSASGDISLKGFLGNPTMLGTLNLNNAGLTFPYLNIDYNFVGESIITLDEQSFILQNINLLDTEYGSKGKLEGEIVHQNFNQWFLNIQIDTDNLLVLNTKNTDDALYYGSGFLKGTASITGLTDQLTIDINGSTQPGTAFVVPLKDIKTVNNYKLIHFKSDLLKATEKQRELAKNALKGLSLNINLDVTKDARMQVVIDEIYGSQLTGLGSGTLDIQINPGGKFNIFGDYTIDSGVYDFKYGGIVNRPFLIQKGGTVSWNGDPYEANLNLAAIYKARANPSVLLQNFNSSRNIEVDLVTKITGGLFNSLQELDIELPNVDPSIATELEFILNDNNVNEKTTQFISLLTFGSFVNPDKINFDSTSAITSTASNAITAAFSSLINSSDSKFKFGVDYVQGIDNSDTDKLNIDNQVDVSVSTNVSDRIIINGKVGVPVGAKTQSSVIGQVKVEVLLNKAGTFRGVIFNRQNEIQYSTEEEGYTQGVGLSYQVNFNTFSDFLRKAGIKKNKIRN